MQNGGCEHAPAELARSVRSRDYAPPSCTSSRSLYMRARRAWTRISIIMHYVCRHFIMGADVLWNASRIGRSWRGAIMLRLRARMGCSEGSRVRRRGARCGVVGTRAGRRLGTCPTEHHAPERSAGRGPTGRNGTVGAEYNRTAVMVVFHGRTVRADGECTGMRPVQATDGNNFKHFAFSASDRISGWCTEGHAYMVRDSCNERAACRSGL
ncbi:hypothetical protein BC834DRAFT_313674 [Gloeopeniophorella convolvens]|nr:hypothetical protein BC834DRAFT_313674 [Gloeopeniophorella convolvens]